MKAPLPLENSEFVAACGLNTEFRQPLRPAPPTGAEAAGDIGPFLCVDF